MAPTDTVAGVLRREQVISGWRVTRSGNSVHLRQISRPGYRSLQTPQRRRALLQHLQAMARHRHQIRQTRPHLPRRSRPTRHHHLAQRVRRHAL